MQNNKQKKRKNRNRIENLKKLKLFEMIPGFKIKTLEPKVSTTIMTIRDEVLERCDDIIKPENDDRSYRGLVLNNKMKVLLISDPKTDKSAAALNVNIGNMCDPDDLPGLANFCKHMLLQGTEKYPEQNDYDNYLSENDGVSNASTYFDHTIYHFKVNPTKLTGALERFAQFFLAPLFTDSLTELELNAIHSEHLRNMECDTWRCNQLEKSFANPRHPYSKFATGNRETLDVLPKQMGINVRQRLLEFHEIYYSANIMSLCVLGVEILDELEEMVVSLFSQVRNKEIDIPICHKHPFDDDHFRTKLYMVPIKDTRNLRVAFPVPFVSDLQGHYQAASRYYFSYLLTHKGGGSLLSALKTKGWCNSVLYAEQTVFRGFGFFILQFDLTEEGIKHVDHIITLMFQYFNMLKKQGPIEWIYNECRDLAEMNFRFSEKQEPGSYVFSRVVELWNYPMKEILCGDIFCPQWKPELVNILMKYLTPQNIRVLVAAKTYEDVANETERWSGTKYKKEKISTEIIDMWENAGYNSEFYLPAKNEFIPSRLDLKPRDDKVEKFPTIIKDTSIIRLWFKQDDEYLVPKAKMFFKFVSSYVLNDAVNFLLTVMYTHLLQDSLAQYEYLADLAGLHWSVEYTLDGIMLIIHGYDDKQHLLLEKIVDLMLTLKIDPGRFEILKENYIRDVKNFVSKPSDHPAMHYLTLLLEEPSWTKSELLNVTDYLTVDRLQPFIPRLFSQMHVECLIHGNMIEKEALDIAITIESKLNSAIPYILPLWRQQLLIYREIKLDDGFHFLLQTQNKLYKNLYTGVYYQIGMKSTEFNMLLELLTYIINKRCFNILRTQEQLGSTAFCSIHKLCVIQGLIVVVQSDKNPLYVEQRIDSFLHSMLDYISTMSKEKFEEHKDSLVTLCVKNSRGIFRRSNMFWNEITQQIYNFDRVNIEMAYLKTVTQKLLFNFFKETVYSPTRRKLSLHMMSTVMDNDESEEKKDEYEDMLAMGRVVKINDIFSFKRSQCLYPLLKPYGQFPRKGMSCPT